MTSIFYRFLCKTFIFCLFSSLCVAQTQITTINNFNNPEMIQKVMSQGAVYFPSAPPTDIEGSVYFEEEYLDSKLVLKQGDSLKGIALRYNILNDAMEFLEKEQIRAFHKEKVKEVTIGKNTFVVIEIKEDNEKKLKYMKTANSKFILALESYELEIKSPYYNPAIHSERPQREIIKKTLLFANLPNKEIIAIRKKADLLTLVSDKSKEVEEYMKKNKLSVKKLEELQKILEYYTSL